MTPDPSSSAVALPAPAGVIAPAARAKPDMRLLGFLALGPHGHRHQPGLAPGRSCRSSRTRSSLSYTATGVIVLAANITSSLIQPLFGYLADKTARRWLLPISVLLSAVGMGLLGLAPSYGAVLALVVITGFGVAAYHPEGYRTATAVAGERKATGVSIFSTGGNIGIALGPPLLTAAAHHATACPAASACWCPGCSWRRCSPRCCRGCPRPRPGGARPRERGGRPDHGRAR